MLEKYIKKIIFLHLGKSVNTMIIMGDYDKKDNIKGKEPTICKKFRKIFRNHKYEVYLVNEFNTSKLCNECENECETFLERISKKPKNKGKLTICWGLVRCNNGCKLIHNRDKNACLNMFKIVECLFKGNRRPKKYCRKLFQSRLTTWT